MQPTVFDSTYVPRRWSKNESAVPVGLLIVHLPLPDSLPANDPAYSMRRYATIQLPLIKYFIQNKHPHIEAHLKSNLTFADHFL